MGESQRHRREKLLAESQTKLKMIMSESETLTIE